MKVTCRINNINNIADDIVKAVLKKKIFRSDGEIDIQLEKEYIVYGIVFWENSPWYYLCTDTNDEYPKPYAADLFCISDYRLSSYWRLSYCTNYNHSQVASLVFEEWAKDRAFYERLIDGETAEVEMFRKYKTLMDSEYLTG